MARASSADIIILGKRRRKRLERIVARATAPQHLVLRATIVLAAWRRQPNAKIARDLGVCVDTVRKWRARFRREGIPGLFDGPAGSSPVTGCRISCDRRDRNRADTAGRRAVDPRRPAEYLNEPVGISASSRADPRLVRRQTPPSPRWLTVPPTAFPPKPRRVRALPGSTRRHGAVQVDEKTCMQAAPVSAPPARSGRRPAPRVRVRPPRTVSLMAAMNLPPHLHPKIIKKNDSDTFTRVPHRTGEDRRPVQEDSPDPR